MWDKEGSGFFCIKALRDGTKNIHLGYGIIIAKDTVKVSIFDAICEVKEKWGSVFRVNKLKTVVWLS